MEKLRMLAFKDKQFSQAYEKKRLDLSINPESLTFNKKIQYKSDQQLASTSGNNAFEKYLPEELSFSFVVDTTGAVEGTTKADKVYTKIKELEDVLYTYKGETHRPSYIIIAFGDMIFKGQLSSMKTDYTLFNDKGIPLQANVQLSFCNYCDSEEENKKNSKQSPDMSRLIVLKENDTLANLCHLIYGNSRLVAQVARFNNLNGFRDLPIGTELLFPSLKKII